MSRENPTQPAGGVNEDAQDVIRLQRNVEAVIARYIQDLTRAA